MSEMELASFNNIDWRSHTDMRSPNIINKKAERLSLRHAVLFTLIIWYTEVLVVFFIKIPTSIIEKIPAVFWSYARLGQISLLSSYKWINYSSVKCHLAFFASAAAVVVFCSPNAKC